jgi:hypothetical protein
MLPQRGIPRVVMMLWAVLQLAVPTVAVVADTAATTASVGAHAHVESRSDASCIRVHDAECVFCQLLSTGAAPAGLVIAAPIAAIVTQEKGFPAAMPDAGATRGVSLPRAPPLA